MIFKKLLALVISLSLFYCNQAPAAPLTIEFVEKLITYLSQRKGPTPPKLLTAGGASGETTEDRIVIFKKGSSEYSDEEGLAIESITKLKVALDLFLQKAPFDNKKPFLIGLYSGINNTQLRKAYLRKLKQTETYPIEKDAENLYYLLLQTLNEDRHNENCLSLIAFTSGFLEGLELARQYDDEIRFVEISQTSIQEKFDGIYTSFLCAPILTISNTEYVRSQLSVTCNIDKKTFFNSCAIAGQSVLDLVTSMGESTPTLESIHTKRVTRWNNALKAVGIAPRRLVLKSSTDLVRAPSGGAGAGAGSSGRPFAETAIARSAQDDPYDEETVYEKTKMNPDEPMFVAAYAYAFLRPTKPLAHNTFIEACQLYIRGIRTKSIKYLSRYDGLVEGAKYYNSPTWLKPSYDNSYRDGYFSTCLEDVENAFIKSNVSNPENAIDIESLMFLRGFITKTLRTNPEYNGLANRPSTEEIPQIIKFLRDKPTNAPLAIKDSQPKKKKGIKKPSGKTLTKQEIADADAAARELLLIEEGEKAALLKQKEREEELKRIQEEHNQRQRAAAANMRRKPNVASAETADDFASAQRLTERATHDYLQELDALKEQQRALQEQIALIEQRHKEHAEERERRQKQSEEERARRLAESDGAAGAAEGGSEDRLPSFVEMVAPAAASLSTPHQATLRQLDPKAHEEREEPSHEKPWLYQNPFIAGTKYGAENLVECIKDDLYIYIQKKSGALDAKSQWAGSKTPQAKAAVSYWNGVISAYVKLASDIIKSFNSGTIKGLEQKRIDPSKNTHQKNIIECITRRLKRQSPSHKNICKYYHHKGLLRAYNAQPGETFKPAFTTHEIALILEERPPLTDQSRRSHTTRDYPSTHEAPATRTYSTSADTPSDESTFPHSHPARTPTMFFAPPPIVSYQIIKHHFDRGFLIGQKTLAGALFENPYAYASFAHSAHGNISHLIQSAPHNICVIKEWEGFLAGCYDLESRCRIACQNGFVAGYETFRAISDDTYLECYKTDIASREASIRTTIQTSVTTGTQISIDPAVIIDLFYRKQFFMGYQQARQENTVAESSTLLMRGSETRSLEAIMSASIEELISNEENEAIGRGFYYARGLFADAFFENRNAYQELKEDTEKRLQEAMNAEEKNIKHIQFFQGALKGLESLFEPLKKAIQDGIDFCNNTSMRDDVKAVALASLQEEIATTKRAIEETPQHVTHDMLEKLNLNEYFLKAYEQALAENALEREIETTSPHELAEAETEVALIAVPPHFTEEAVVVEEATEAEAVVDEAGPAGAGAGDSEGAEAPLTDYGYAEDLTNVQELKELREAEIEKEVLRLRKEREIKRIVELQRQAVIHRQPIERHLLENYTKYIQVLERETIKGTEDLKWQLIQKSDQILRNAPDDALVGEVKTNLNRRLNNLAISFTRGIGYSFDTTKEEHTAKLTQARNYCKNFSKLLDHEDCTEPLKALIFFFENMGYIYGTKEAKRLTASAYKRSPKPEKKVAHPTKKTGPITEEQRTQKRMNELIKAAGEDTFSAPAGAPRGGGGSAGAGSH